MTSGEKSRPASSLKTVATSSLGASHEGQSPLGATHAREEAKRQKAGACDTQPRRARLLLLPLAGQHQDLFRSPTGTSEEDSGVNTVS